MTAWGHQHASGISRLQYNRGPGPSVRVKRRRRVGAAHCPVATTSTTPSRPCPSSPPRRAALTASVSGFAPASSMPTQTDKVCLSSPAASVMPCRVLLSVPVWRSWDRSFNAYCQPFAAITITYCLASRVHSFACRLLALCERDCRRESVLLKCWREQYACRRAGCFSGRRRWAGWVSERQRRRRQH